MPSLGCLDRLVADVGVDFASELLVTETQAHGVGSQVVQQLRRGHATEILGVNRERLHDRLYELGDAPFDALVDLLGEHHLLLFAYPVVEQRPDEASGKERPSNLPKRDGMYPAPRAQVERGHPPVDHHQKNAREGQRDREQRRFGSAEFGIHGWVSTT